MAEVRTANVIWNGDLVSGSGLITYLTSGVVSRDDGRHWQKLPDLPLVSLGFVGAQHFLGPLALSFDASGQLSGYLPNRPTSQGDPDGSGIVLLRRNRWQAAHVPYRTATYTYDADGVCTATAAAPALMAIGIDGAHGTVPALVEYEVPK